MTPETALRAIVARIQGDFDNPALAGFGPLTDTISDVLAIAAAVRPAPDLLTPLKRLVQQIMEEAGGADLLPVHPEHDPENYEAVQEARRAIAEAEAVQREPGADMTMSGHPGPIPEGTRTNFQTLLAAARDGRLALLSCKDQASGEDRAVICAVNRPAQPGGEIEMVPLGVMAWDDPYTLFAPPL